MNTAVWKWVAGVLSALLLAVGSHDLFLFNLLRSRPTVEEVRQMIGSESPYAKDRALLLRLVEDNTKALREQSRVLGELRVAVSVLTREVAQEE